MSGMKMAKMAKEAYQAWRQNNSAGMAKSGMKNISGKHGEEKRNGGETFYGA